MQDHPLRVEARAAPLREEVANRLRDAIVSGFFHPGQRLVERELVTWTSVSRTTIREAVRQLETEGLVTAIPNQGIVVTTLSPDQARETYEVLGRIQGLAASRFSENASPEELDHLRACCARLEEAGTDTIAFMRIKQEFFELLIDGAGSELIRSLHKQLYTRIALLRSTTISVPTRPSEIIEELARVIDAIAGRDPEAIEEAVRDHLERASRVAAQLLSEANVQPSVNVIAESVEIGPTR